MRLFDKKAEKIVWISLIISIPVLLFVLHNERGTIGLTDIFITSLTLIIGIGILYLVKWYSNK